MNASINIDKKIAQIFDRADRIGFDKKSEVMRAALIYYDSETLIPLENARKKAGQRIRSQSSEGGEDNDFT